MIIKNNLGLEVSIEKDDMEYVVSKYQKSFDDISNLENLEKKIKNSAKRTFFVGALTGGFLYGLSKYIYNLRYNSSKEVIREICKDERATDVFKELLYGGK